jgi:hypothetical protein
MILRLDSLRRLRRHRQFQLLVLQLILRQAEGLYCTVSVYGAVCELDPEVAVTVMV